MVHKPTELSGPDNTSSKDHCAVSQRTPGRGKLESAYEHHAHGRFLPCHEVGIAFLTSGSRKKQLRHKQQFHSSHLLFSSNSIFLKEVQRAGFFPLNCNHPTINLVLHSDPPSKYTHTHYTHKYYTHTSYIYTTHTTHKYCTHRHSPHIWTTHKHTHSPPLTNIRTKEYVFCICLFIQWLFIKTLLSTRHVLDSRYFCGEQKKTRPCFMELTFLWGETPWVYKQININYIIK